MSTASLRLVAATMLVACGCGKSRTSASTSAHETGTAASNESVSWAAPPILRSAPLTNADPRRPRYLRRQRPEASDASSATDDAHRASAAFDGDRTSAWTTREGAGAWIEATFYKPRIVWGLVVDTGVVGAFTDHAHGKRLRLLVDGSDVEGRDVGDDEPSIAFEAIDRRASKLRVVVDDLFAGGDGNFGISEIALLVDGARLPSVAESVVAHEVSVASTRRHVAAVLHRFGVNPAVDRGGEITFDDASLVDGLGRERLLIASLRGDGSADGLRDEDDHLVFLGTTEAGNLVALGDDVVSARTTEGAPIVIELRPLHAADVQDVVARWSTCATAVTPACSGVRAWTMQRGYPERIVDAVGEGEVRFEGDAPPYTTVIGDVEHSFDRAAFVYR